MQAAAATAIPCRPRYSGVRPGRREFSAGVLVLWIGFLLLNFLQPCCESIAELLPHRHGAPVASHVDGPVLPDAHRAPGSHGPSAAHEHSGLHEHCATSDGLDTSLPAFLASSVYDFEPQIALAVLLFVFSYRIPAQVRACPRARRERGPPHRFYLATLRLRI